MSDDQAPAPEPIMSPGHDTLSVEAREDSYTDTGSTARMAWGARTDVGLVQGEHVVDSVAHHGHHVFFPQFFQDLAFLFGGDPAEDRVVLRRLL